MANSKRFLDFIRTVNQPECFQPFPDRIGVVALTQRSGIHQPDISQALQLIRLAVVKALDMIYCINSIFMLTSLQNL